MSLVQHFEDNHRLSSPGTGNRTALGRDASLDEIMGNMRFSSILSGFQETSAMDAWVGQFRKEGEPAYAMVQGFQGEPHL